MELKNMILDICKWWIITWTWRHKLSIFKNLSILTNCEQGAEVILFNYDNGLTIINPGYLSEQWDQKCSEGDHFFRQDWGILVDEASNFCNPENYLKFLNPGCRLKIEGGVTAILSFLCYFICLTGSWTKTGQGFSLTIYLFVQYL